MADILIMKKILTFFIAISLFACSDGDFDVPEFQFTSDVHSCDEYLIYVTSSEKTEAMAITLLNGQLGTTVGEATYPVSSTLSIVYRIFDEGIGTNYFCEIIPPTSPKVTRQLIAESGEVQIITSEIIKNDVVTGYSYEISILNLLFVDGNERIFYETFPIGTFTVKI